MACLSAWTISHLREMTVVVLEIGVTTIPEGSMMAGGAMNRMEIFATADETDTTTGTDMMTGTAIGIGMTEGGTMTDLVSAAGTATVTATATATATVSVIATATMAVSAIGYAMIAALSISRVGPSASPATRTSQWMRDWCRPTRSTARPSSLMRRF